MAAVHFFATEKDENLLLSKVCGAGTCLFFRWGKLSVQSPMYLDSITLGSQSETVERYGILDPSLGHIRFVADRPTKEDVDASLRRFKSLAFNAINWDALAPLAGEGLVDWDRTPALFWRRGRWGPGGALILGEIGSQASAMEDVSHAYGLWVNRVMAWVRKHGTKVAANGKPEPLAQGFRLQLLGVASALFALPDALQALESGVEGRTWIRSLGSEIEPSGQVGGSVR